MNAYTIQFYDLLSRALGGSESKHIQGFLDDVMARCRPFLIPSRFRSVLLKCEKLFS